MTNDFDLITIRRDLDAMRRKHGAQSPIGARCSDLIQQLKNYETASGDQKANLEKCIAKTVEQLAGFASWNRY